MAGEDRSRLATAGSEPRSSVLMFENSQIVHLAVGRSTVRRRILALLLAEPGPRLHLREIQRRAATSPGTASRELAKLVSAGLIERETEANQVYFRGSASPFATMLRSFLVGAPTPPPASSGLPADGAGSAPPLHVVAEPSPSQAERVAINDGGSSGVMADPLGLKTGAVVAARMREIYGERVRGVFLYGHRAAGRAPRESDVELLIVLDRIERYGEELDRTSPVFASLSLELGAVVGRVFVSEADWRGRTDGGLPEVRAEAVSL
jgi:predicted nucleotidyltransferase/DNA-binding transcriptional ArsR family regulator